MKKILSIPYAMLILLSGMHFSIAKHICGGEITAVKWSFIGEEASCDMEKMMACTIHDTFESGCCDNDVDVFSVDTDYSKSLFQYNEHTNVLEIALNSYSENLYQPYTAEISLSSNSPPNPYYSSAVSLSEICIFRI
jgi:hypothetical protein